MADLDCGRHPPEKPLDPAYPSLCGVKIRRYLVAFHAGKSEFKITMCDRLIGRIIYTLVLHNADEAMANEYFDNGTWAPQITTVLNVLDQQVWHLCGASWEDFSVLQRTMLYSVSKLARAVAAKRAGRSIDAKTLREWRDNPALAKQWVRSEATTPRYISGSEKTGNNCPVTYKEAAIRGGQISWTPLDPPSDEEMDKFLPDLIDGSGKADVWASLNELSKAGSSEARVSHYFFHQYASMRLNNNAESMQQLMDGNEEITLPELIRMVLVEMFSAKNAQLLDQVLDCPECEIGEAASTGSSMGD